MSLAFTKINNELFNLDDSTEVVTAVDGIMAELSNGDSSGFQESINAMLRDRMISRYVASRFYADNIDALSATNYIVIDINIGSRVLSITVGKSPLNGEKLDGVLYA